MDQSKIEKIIGKVNGTMAIEGMPLTDEDKNRMRDCLSGRVTYNDMIKSLVNKHLERSAGLDQ